MAKLSLTRIFRRRGRGRLVRHYFFISVLLIGGGLIASGLLEVYFRYQETRQNLALLQQEITASAAFKIERFIQEIERTMKGATRSREIAPKGLTPEYRFELEKLLLIEPSITEAVALGEDGMIRVQASRLRTVLPEGKKNLSNAPSFQQARQGKAYFGPVYFVRGSEPYMTIAVPIERFAGDVIGVLQAEVNLKYIGDVVSSITVGKTGYAYLVTRSGDLVAHPDISLVLQRRNVSRLKQVATAFRTTQGAPRLGSVETQNLQGTKVFSSYALIPTLDWAVFIERPLQEAYEPLYASILRTSTLLLVGLGMALLASLFVARRVVRPLRKLHEGVERIASGDLSFHLDVKTGDEIESLAEEFNKMTSELRESYTNLEQKVEERTRELSEALEQQTATSGILKVIASSPTDIQPVLVAVAENAARLCEASSVVIHRFDGHALRRAVVYGELPSGPIGEERPLSRGLVSGRAIIDRQTIHVHDIAAEFETEFPDDKHYQTRWGTRTMLATPMLREGVPIGVINIRRTELRPFTEKQIALLRTFADQAVIAIENVRLFQEIQERTRELQLSLEEVRALSEVSRTVSSSLDLQQVLDTVASHAVNLSRSDGCGIFEFDPGRRAFEIVASHNLSDEFLAAIRGKTIDLGKTTIGQAAESGQPIQVSDIESAYDHPFREFTLEAGFHAVLTVPMSGGDEVTRGIVLFRRSPGQFDERVANLLTALANQSKVAIQNARLFQEIDQKSQQLETANKHKSQFLANVSHELRTPLNSIIGFTRIVLRKTEGQIADLQKQNLQKVLISSEHLLNLINGLLDLSKIEAGRMEAYAETFKLDDVIRLATSTVEPMLKDGRVRLVSEIAPAMPPLKTDRDKLKQVILNLLSNSVKFTEKGEIKVSAWRENGTLKLTVSDTGIGMKKEALDYIFDEFRQADMSSTRRYGGTGLGLAIVKRFVNLMGGDISVESEMGKGSKFTITMPMSLKAQ